MILGGNDTACRGTIVRMQGLCLVLIKPPEIASTRAALAGKFLIVCSNFFFTCFPCQNVTIKMIFFLVTQQSRGGPLFTLALLTMFKFSNPKIALRRPTLVTDESIDFRPPQINSSISSTQRSPSKSLLQINKEMKNRRENTEKTIDQMFWREERRRSHQIHLFSGPL